MPTKKSARQSTKGSDKPMNRVSKELHDKFVESAPRMAQALVDNLRKNTRDKQS